MNDERGVDSASESLASCTQPGVRQSVKQNVYVCHVYARSDNLAAVLISDHDYPYLVGHASLSNVLNEYVSKVDQESGGLADESNVFGATLLSAKLNEYQDPREVAVSAEMRQDLDETKIICRSKIEDVLQRDDQLCEIEHKPERLSENCKPFRNTDINWRCNIG